MFKTLLGWVTRTPAPTSETSDQSPAKIARHELPGGRVFVTVHDQVFNTVDGPATCWTYVSDGLSHMLKKEVVLSIQRDEKDSLEDYPRDVLAFFGWLYTQGRERAIEPGIALAVDPEHVECLGEPRRTAVAFTPQELSGGLSRAFMTALLLTTSEFDAVNRFGLVRFMGQLGSRYRHFPTAAWCVRGRPDVVSASDMSSSVLARTPLVRTVKTHAYVRGVETRRESLPSTGSLDNDRLFFARREVVLEMFSEAAVELHRAFDGFPDDREVSILMAPDPDADSSMVWTPGQKEMNAIGLRDGTRARIAGNHVVFLPGEAEDRVGILEDGFAVLLTDATWREIRQLFGAGPQNWGMPVTGDLGFRVKIGVELDLL